MSDAVEERVVASRTQRLSVERTNPRFVQALCERRCFVVDVSSAERERWYQSLWGTRAIFLLDGVGAVVTATSVGIVLPQFQAWIGLPVVVLRALGGVALFFAVFSLSRQYSGRVNAASLRIIARANLTYCAATALLLAVYASEVTVLAAVYFLGEIVIVVFLSKRELALARGMTSPSAGPSSHSEHRSG